MTAFNTALIAALLVSAVGQAQAAASEFRQFSTGPERAVMVELYTSEGCSSCPRADAWLSKFKDDARLWKQVFPMAFHVDYWDRLGWPDRFASEEWTTRQRSYGKLWRARTIYTPGFAVNGQEWRGFFKGEKLPVRPSSKPGKLTLSSNDEIAWRLSFAPATSREELVAHVAMLGFDESTAVARGENRGRRLSHDFIVLSLKHAPLKSTATTVRTKPDRAKAKRLAVVAWISKPGDPTPLQVTGGWLD